MGKLFVVAAGEPRAVENAHRDPDCHGAAHGRTLPEETIVTPPGPDAGNLPGPARRASTGFRGGRMTTETQTQYQHLKPRPGSNYRQLFLKGRRIRAAVVDEAIHGPDPRTPEEFARDYQVPLEAVLEALDYVAQNRPLIEQERDREAAKLRARGCDGPAQA